MIDGSHQLSSIQASGSGSIQPTSQDPDQLPVEVETEAHVLEDLADEGLDDQEEDPEAEIGDPDDDSDLDDEFEDEDLDDEFDDEDEEDEDLDGDLDEFDDE